jgi:hypothetical protein
VEALLVIVPRHPNRFETVAALIAAARPGKPVLRRAALDRPTLDLRGGDILLGDSMGEMQNWYACADVVIMGGSLLPYGSHNLIEANALGCPVVLGPSLFNFEQAATESIAAGGSVQVADTAAALRAAAEIAADQGRRARMSVAALSFAQAHRGRPNAPSQPSSRSCSAAWRVDRSSRSEPRSACRLTRGRWRSGRSGGSRLAASPGSARGNPASCCGRRNPGARLDCFHAHPGSRPVPRRNREPRPARSPTGSSVQSEATAAS